MDAVRLLVVGAGISGLSTIAFGREKDYRVIDRDEAVGGYCKTVKQDGFVWDYSGHFFHFKHPDVEAWLRARMPGQKIITVDKKSFISYKGRFIDFPFQKNIHQLPHAEFVECLVDLYFAHHPEEPGALPPERNFKEMLFARFGKAIAEKFLIPYNEKLYATDLSSLDKDAMGRFFPHADLRGIVRNMRTPDNATYNASFTYPEGGAVEYVHALESAVEANKISLNEELLRVDLRERIATTSKRQLKFERLVSSVPFDKLARSCGIGFEDSAFSWNKVLVFNLGFDKKGPRDVHWIYYPDPNVCFYRVGFYDNIVASDRMSLYVELGYSKNAMIDVDSAKKQVLADLSAVGVVTDQKLAASHSVVMDPAYVHVTRQSMAEHTRVKRMMNAHGVYPIGRYGGWTYCSIEDNMVEARSLVADFL